MKKLNHFSKSLVALLLAFLVLCLPSFAEPKYELTEEELTTLETNLETQAQQIETQKTQLKTLNEKLSLLNTQLIISNNAIENAQKSLQIYEEEERNKKLKTGLIVGGVCISICLPVGFFLGALTFK